MTRHGIVALAAGDFVLPDVERLREQVVRSQQDFPLSRLFPHLVMRGNRIVRRAVSQEDKAATEFVQDLVRVLEFQVGCAVAWVFDAIHQKGGSVRDEVMDFVQQSPVIGSHRYRLLDLALDRYCWTDYTSSIHLLVFQIEGIVRDLAHVVGLETIGQNEDTTSARLLHDLLRDERMESVLGDNLSEALKAVLVDRAGMNVRNLVAHGLARADDLSEELADLLIALLLRIAVVQSVRPVEGGQGPRSGGSGCTEAGEQA